MMNGVKWTEKGAKDGTWNPSTKGAGRVLSNGDRRVWSEKQEENLQRLSQKPRDRASLVAQWLRIHLPMQGTWV